MKGRDALELSVEELVAAGADSIEAHCGYCGKTWPALIDIMPDRTTLRKIRALLTCPTCGHADIDVEPIWPAAPSAH